MNENVRFRLGGLLVLTISAGFGWLFIWKPLQQAQAHVPAVKYSFKVFRLGLT